MWPIGGGEEDGTFWNRWDWGPGMKAAEPRSMDEMLPTDRGEVRPEISDLTPGEAWNPPPRSDGDDEPERPETD